MTDAGIFFCLAYAGRQRGVLLSTAALRQLVRRPGYIMGYMDIFRAHEALIHANASAVASGGNGAALYLDAAHFAVERQPSAWRQSPV